MPKALTVLVAADLVKNHRLGRVNWLRAPLLQIRYLRFRLLFNGQSKRFFTAV